MLHVRGQPEDYDAWRDGGCEGWGYADVLPYFMRSEDQENGDRALHGKGGPLSVSRARVKLPVIDAFLQACAEVGIGSGGDLNGRRPEGAGYGQTTTRDGWRCSSATAYLSPDVRARETLTVETGCTVSRILFADGGEGEGLRATGVEYSKQVLRQRTAHQVTARRETILAAGAIGSPHLLMLSGVGEPKELARHGIPLRHSLPGVGKNLQDHLQVRTTYRSSCRTINDEVRSPVGLLKMAFQWLFWRSGPLTMAPTPAVAFARTPLATGGRPDVQIHFGPWTAKSRQTGFFGLSPFRVLDAHSAFTMTVCQMRPRSRGELLLNSAEPGDPPSIRPHYLSEPSDLATAVAGLRWVGHSYACSLSACL